MKYILMLFVFIVIYSCKKTPECYQCDVDYGNGQSIHKEVCKGDVEYDQVVEYGWTPDSAGNPVFCVAK